MRIALMRVTGRSFSRVRGEALENAWFETSTGKAYVYEIYVDDVLRYIGKGRKARIYFHRKAAKEAANRCGRKTKHLHPHFHRKLVEAIQLGSTVMERIVVSALSDGEAFRIETHLIGEMHRNHPGKLWDTIDERFIDPKYLPAKWRNPVNPLYRLPRPLKMLPDGGIFGSYWGKRFVGIQQT